MFFYYFFGTGQNRCFRQQLKSTLHFFIFRSPEKFLSHLNFKRNGSLGSAFDRDAGYPESNEDSLWRDFTKTTRKQSVPLEILQQLRLVLYPIIYMVLATSQRWLFGVSSINSILDHCIFGSQTKYPTLRGDQTCGSMVMLSKICLRKKDVHCLG